MNQCAKQQAKAVLWGNITRGTQIAFSVYCMTALLLFVLTGGMSTTAYRATVMAYSIGIVLFITFSAVSIRLARIHQTRYLIQTRLKACPGCLYSFATLSRSTSPAIWFRCPECGHRTKWPLLQHWWRDRIRRSCLPPWPKSFINLLDRFR